MRSWLAVACVPALVLLSHGRPCPSPVRSPTAVAERHDGLWIWTRADLPARRRDVGVGVLVATLVANGDRVVVRRGLSPGLSAPGPVALVVRLDDSLHRAFRERAPDALAEAVDPLLRRVLAEARATGAVVSEIQLDYDAPVHRLAAWADVLRVLKRGALAELDVWITSIPAHLDEPAYEALFSGLVEGHELQLFDTGLSCNARELARLRSRLSRSSLPFRVGVGAFERSSGGRDVTRHACWARAARELESLPSYAGTWVFPAGNADALALLEEP